MKISELELKSIQYRRTVIQIIKKAKGGHTGGSLSCVDILNVLYNHIMNVSPENFSHPDRDRYIHSKGHSVESLYTVLQDRGFFPAEELETLGRYRSHFIGHPTRKVPGIEQNSGALGHGLPISAGIALAGKKDGRKYRVYTTLGDGELAEGSVWEAAMFAAHYRLDNLVIIIDYNTLQISGRTTEVMSTEPLEQKFLAFGMAVRHVGGHDIPALVDLLESVPFEPGKPSLILAHTTKGKGVSFIEDNVIWHHHVPSDEEFEEAMKEFDSSETDWQERNENTTGR